MSDGVLTRFTATFEESCDWTGVLRGCVHFEQ